MICPNCGYMMDAFEKVCPRCKGEKIVAPARQATPPLSPPPSPPPPTQPNLPYQPSTSHEPKPTETGGRYPHLWSYAGLGLFLGWNAIAFTQGSQATALISACVAGAIGAAIGYVVDES